MSMTTAPGTPTGERISAQGLGEYLRGVQEELKKATWPTREELIRLTQVVLALIFVVSAYCGTLDFLIGLATNALLHRTG